MDYNKEIDQVLGKIVMHIDKANVLLESEVKQNKKALEILAQAKAQKANETLPSAMYPEVIEDIKKISLESKAELETIVKQAAEEEKSLQVASENSDPPHERRPAGAYDEITTLSYDEVKEEIDKLQENFNQLSLEINDVLKASCETPPSPKTEEIAAQNVVLAQIEKDVDQEQEEQRRKIQKRKLEDQPNF